jgi:hypothetical protein
MVYGSLEVIEMAKKELTYKTPEMLAVEEDRGWIFAENGSADCVCVAQSEDPSAGYCVYQVHS